MRFEIKRAIVLFTVESGSENQVLESVKKLEGVEEAYISYGVYDIVVKVRVDSMDDLKELISKRLRKISKVRSTLTLILVQE
jgi:DNA-binding Lrp family transcriptional regulator